MDIFYRVQYFRLIQSAVLVFTIPYIDGSVSISRTARTYPAYLIFKPGMFVTAILLVIYWRAYNKLIQTINNDFSQNKYFLYFGVGSALFLLIHSFLLGVKFDLDLYKFFRRFVILAFIIFEIAAQAILINNLIKIKNNIEGMINKKVLILKIVVVVLLIVVGVISLPFFSNQWICSLQTCFGMELFSWRYSLLPVHFPVLEKKFITLVHIHLFRVKFHSTTQV